MNTQRRTIIIKGQFCVPNSLFLVKNGNKERMNPKRRTMNEELRTGGFRAAFTLMELLVVIAIIALLLGIIVPSYFSIRDKAKYTKAKVTAKNLETAFKGYLDHYRVWPSVFTDESTPLEIKDEIYRILRGENVGSDNMDSIAFYEFETTNSSDGALDAWSDPSDSTTWQTYRVRVDRNYDNKIAVGGQDLYRTVIVWSAGTNRVDDGGAGDDVKSWD